MSTLNIYVNLAYLNQWSKLRVDMPTPEYYTPSVDEYRVAEEIMTEEQKRDSDERVRAFAESKPNRLNEKTGTLLHPIAEQLIEFENLPSYAEQHGFTRKPEFHFTVISNRSGKIVKERLGQLPDDERRQAVQRINEAAQKVDWSMKSGELRRVIKDYVVTNDRDDEISRERRESIIQLLDIPGIAEFYATLNEVLGTAIEPPPAHITLYSTSSDPKNISRGIGIESQAEMDGLHPEPVDLKT